MYAGILTFPGITFLKREITILEQTKTAVAATPIPIAFEAEVVTAKVGQVPKTRHKTGFSLIIPLENSLKSDFFSINYPSFTAL